MDKEAKSQVYVNLDDPHRVEYQKKRGVRKTLSKLNSTFPATIFSSEII